MTTTGKLFAEPTTRSKTKKTTPDRHRGQRPQQFKSSYKSSQTSNPSNTMRFERFTKKGKPTIQWDKKYSSHFNDKTLNTHRLENDTLLRLQEAIKTSTCTPGAMKERYPYLNSNYKDHRFKYIFHDYFNDLLVWHNDTLNKNIANVWDPVKGLHKDIFTIPGKLESLTKEVDLMNKYLTSFEVLRSGDGNNMKNKITKLKKLINKTEKDVTKAMQVEEDRISQQMRNEIAPSDKNSKSKMSLVPPTDKSKNKKLKHSVRTPYKHRAARFNLIPRRKLNNYQINQDVENTIDRPFNATAFDVAKADYESNDPTSLDTNVSTVNDTTDVLFDKVRSYKRNEHHKGINRNVKSRDAKIITPPKPEQYFATPVPMSTTEFNQFLKDNLMGVSVVTTPFTETNYDEGILLAKKKAYVQSAKLKSKKIESVVRNLKTLPFITTAKLMDDFDAGNEFQMLEDLENSLRNDYYNVKVQRRRIDDGNPNEYSANIADYAINEKVLEDFKRKLKFFEKEKEKEAHRTSPGDVDIMIIDLNYDTHSPDEETAMEKLLESSGEKTNNVTTEVDIEPTKTITPKKPDQFSNSVQKPDETSYGMHNKLLYGPGKHIISQIERQDFTDRSNSDGSHELFNDNMLADNKVDDKFPLMSENTFGEMTPNTKDDKEFGQDMTIYTPDTKQAELPELFQILTKTHDKKEHEQSNAIVITKECYTYSVKFKTPDDTTKTSNNMTTNDISNSTNVRSKLHLRHLLKKTTTEPEDSGKVHTDRQHCPGRCRLPQSTKSDHNRPPHLQRTNNRRRFSNRPQYSTPKIPHS
ncbi:uncharacterized protein LOC113227677 [Hyposmocoma kahamanoa]|uniref:uncharacterized protein LOC113227677 n=1 Tax=Hyposmocoma kahamanoa TaxID=1477025 RepID=UPI000E6D791F|nr:uncharacterized protein LOC113227677 [Hyposmocoma kahamanoa]